MCSSDLHAHHQCHNDSIDWRSRALAAEAENAELRKDLAAASAINSQALDRQTDAVIRAERAEAKIANATVINE